MAKKEPLQTARFGHEATRRQRVLIFQDKGLPERVLALAQHAVRFEFIINDNGEVLSLDDVIGSVQVTWGELNTAASKADPLSLPEDWYCVRTLRVSGTQIVHHVTFSNHAKKDVKELQSFLEGHLWNCFPDEKDKHYQRESRNM